VVTAKGNPTLILWHELAHLVCGTTGHGAKWKKVMRDFGAGKEADKYNRKIKEKTYDGETKLPTEMESSRLSPVDPNFDCRGSNLAVGHFVLQPPGSDRKYLGGV
jgi:hypothetical protein